MAVDWGFVDLFQNVEVIGQVGHGEFGFSALEADRADKQTKPVLLMHKDMLDMARTLDLAALARFVAVGMVLPLGLRRWIRLVSILSNSHFSLLRDR